MWGQTASYHAVSSEFADWFSAACEESGRVLAQNQPFEIPQQLRELAERNVE